AGAGIRPFHVIEVQSCALPIYLTAMFADRIAVMSRGKLDVMGTPREALTDERLERVYECSLRVGVPPEKDVPFVLPQSAYRTAEIGRAACRDRVWNMATESHR